MAVHFSYRNRILSIFLPLLLMMIVQIRGYSEVIQIVPAGPLEFIQLGNIPKILTSAYLTDAANADLVIAYETPHISLYRSGRLTTVRIDFSVSLLTVISKPDSPDKLVCVAKGAPEVFIVSYDAERGLFHKEWSITLQEQPYLLKAGDITGNGKTDLLLLMHNKNGVAVLRNKGDDTYGEVEMLFDDLLISDFQVLDLNGDGIADFILHDPIKNALRVHYGFGQLVFSLERNHPLPASIDSFNAVRLFDKAVFDLVTVSQENRNINIYMGDGMGRYSLFQRQPLKSKINGLIFTDLFGNDLPDMVMAESETGIIRFFRNYGKHGFAPAGTVKIEKGIRDIIPYTGDIPGERFLSFMDVRNRRLVLLELLPSVKEFFPRHLALGSEPEDMVTANLFGGELPELYILCPESGTVSIYWFDMKFRLNHTVVELPGRPDRLFVHHGPAGRTKLVVSDRQTDSITVVSMRVDRNEANIYGIPADFGSEVIHLGLTSDERFRISTYSFFGERKIVQLSLFEQIGSDEYIERTVSPIEEERMIALEVEDISGNGLVDMVYLYRRAEDRVLSMTAAFNDDDYIFKRRGNVIEFNGKQFSRGFILSEKVDENDKVHFLVYLETDGEENGHLYRVLGDGEGLLTVIGGWEGRISIPGPKWLSTVSSPGKIYNDIVYYNDAASRIELVRSGSEGDLTAPAVIKDEIKGLTSCTVYSDPTGNIHMLVAGRREMPYTDINRIDE
jgi:hypothetical protein